MHSQFTSPEQRKLAVYAELRALSPEQMQMAAADLFHIWRDIDLTLPSDICQPSPEVREFLNKLGCLNNDETDVFLTRFESELRSRNLWHPIHKQKPFWLCHGGLNAKQALVAAAYILQKPDTKEIKVAELIEMLSEVGRTVSNPSMVARKLAAKDSGLMTIVRADLGPNGLAILLTKDGITEGEKLERKFAHHMS